MTAQPPRDTDRAASEHVESERTRFGMPKAELARRSGVVLRSLNYYLTGERPMTVGTYLALLEVFDAPPPEWFLNR